MPRKRERVYEMDFIRVFAMLSVVLLHTSSAYILNEANITFLGQPLAFVINQAVRYCVPLFFLLSGASLELSYRGENYQHFAAGRLVKILLPYLIWSTLYFVVTVEGFALVDFLRALLLGSAAPQLYFIIALAQLYLLYLPLRWGLEKHPVFTLGLCFLLSFFVQWGQYLMLYEKFLLPVALRPYLVKLFLPWLFCFAFGMFLARTRERWQRAAQHYGLFLCLAALLFTTFYIADSAATGSYDLSVKPILFVYVPLCFFALFALGSYLCKSRALRVVIAWLSARSMTVFFCHIFVLNYLREAIYLPGTSGMLLLCLLTIVLSIALSFVIDFLLLGAKKLSVKQIGTD